MNDTAQHILTWHCGEDEDKDIRQALQTKYSKGKIKCLYAFPQGVQFQARLKATAPFLSDLSRQHPDVEFIQEWASAFHMEAGTSVFLGGGLAESSVPVNQSERMEFARDVWERAAHMEAVLCFKEKIASNWQAYREKLLALPKEDLIDRAEEIAAVKLSREVLTTSCISQDELDYLDRFENPLEVVSDAWLDAQNVDTGGEFNHVLWALRDRQDAEQLYEMEQTM